MLENLEVENFSHLGCDPVSLCKGFLLGLLGLEGECCVVH